MRYVSILQWYRYHIIILSEIIVGVKQFLLTFGQNLTQELEDVQEPLGLLIEQDIDLMKAIDNMICYPLKYQL